MDGEHDGWGRGDLGRSVGLTWVNDNFATKIRTYGTLETSPEMC